MSPDASTPTPAETRDWTFVVRDRCEECGFDPAGLQPGDVSARILATVDKWAAVLNGSGLAARPAPSTWSPLEYACHVRDVCGTFSARLDQILEGGGNSAGAEFADWDQNRAQVKGRYNDSAPLAVAAEYRAAAESLAAQFGAVEGAQWELTGRRGDGALFTTRTLAAYLVHDLEHHLVDARGA